VFALEELHVKEDEIWRTSLALTGAPLDIFNDTVNTIDNRNDDDDLLGC
jgi:hypothetical protein